MNRKLQRLGRLLRSRRRELDLTQAEVAKRVGKSTPTVHRYEVGTVAVPVDVLRKLARALRLAVDPLFEYLR